MSRAGILGTDWLSQKGEREELLSSRGLCFCRAHMCVFIGVRAYCILSCALGLTCVCRLLPLQFSNNLLDATKAFKKLITAKEDVEGLPESALALAAQQVQGEEGCRQGGGRTCPCWRCCTSAHPDPCHVQLPPTSGAAPALGLT